jgi:hypothetical protein
MLWWQLGRKIGVERGRWYWDLNVGWKRETSWRFCGDVAVIQSHAGFIFRPIGDGSREMKLPAPVCYSLVSSGMGVMIVR